MAQLYAVTGLPAARRRQVDEVNARVAVLPSILSQQAQKQFQTAQMENMAASRKMDEARFGLEQNKFGLAEKEYGLKEQEVGLAQKAADFQATKFGWEQDEAKKIKDFRDLQAQREMGVKAAGLGFTAMGSGLTSFKLGDLNTKIGDLWSSITGKAGSETLANRSISDPDHQTSTASGSFGSVPMGSMLTGGLAGFAGSQLLGKSKGMKSLIGAGIGAGAGYFAGDGGWAGALGGGLLGGLGGLF